MAAGTGNRLVVLMPGGAPFARKMVNAALNDRLLPQSYGVTSAYSAFGRRAWDGRARGFGSRFCEPGRSSRANQSPYRIQYAHLVRRWPAARGADGVAAWNHHGGIDPDGP